MQQINTGTKLTQPNILILTDVCSGVTTLGNGVRTRVRTVHLLNRPSTTRQLQLGVGNGTSNKPAETAGISGNDVIGSKSTNRHADLTEHVQAR